MKAEGNIVIQTLSVELFVYLITALCALLLLPRSSNWRLRLLIGTTGLQALAHAASELRAHHPFWNERLSHLTGVLEMFGGALALTAIYLLKRENRDRKSMDAQLRLSEAAVPPAPAPAEESLLARLPREAPAEPREPLAVDLDDDYDLEELDGKPWSDSIRYGAKRRDRRFPASGEIEVTLLGSTRTAFRGQLADISQGGARLFSYEPVTLGTPVKLEFNGHLFLGEVRHCQPWEGRYALGIKFEHSLDLARLSQVLRSNGLATAR